MDLRDRLPGLLALAWVAGILAVYYVENASYYSVKVAVFGHFLLGGG